MKSIRPAEFALVLMLTAAAACTATVGEGSSQTVSAVGEKVKALECGAAGIKAPEALPDVGTCTPDNTDAGCNGWAPVGPYLDTSDELRSLDKMGAQLFTIAPNDTTLCLYLYRGDTAVSAGSLNGVHCYDTNNCDVCWWDGRTDPGVKPTVANLGHSSDDDCSDCHRNGPLLPKNALWTALSDSTAELHAICAGKGGANWQDAPAKWPLRAPDVALVVEAPAGCAAGGCHDNGIAKGGNYCESVDHAFSANGGSMRTNGKRFRTKADCESFRSDMGCLETAIDCSSMEVVRAEAASDEGDGGASGDGDGDGDE